MISLRKLLSASSVLSFSLVFAHGQSSPTIQQRSEKSTCTNIVALAGNVNINCSSLTPEQKILLKRIPVLLKKILANQGDPKVLMDKMSEIEEILKVTSHPTETVNASNGSIAIGGNNSGTAIVNNGVIPRSITAQQESEILKHLGASPAKQIIVGCLITDNETCIYRDRIISILRQAGWNVIEEVIAISGGIPPEGLMVEISSLDIDEPPDGTNRLIYAFKRAGVQIDGEASPDVSKGKLVLEVFSKPTAP